jgi:ribonucleoside-diphosphate reductase alpha chain
MTTQVIKRNGQAEPFDVTKINKVIGWATEGLEVNPQTLKDRLPDFIEEGISTLKIHTEIIEQAKRLISSKKPDWSLVAGRLLTLQLWKEQGSYDKSFLDYMHSQIDAQIYSNPRLNQWSDRDMVELGKHLVKARDLTHDYASVRTIQKRFLLPNEGIQQMYMACAMIIATEEKKADRLSFCLRLYQALSLRKISLASPWLSNLRSKEGNISSCFILDIADSLDSITRRWTDAAQISRSGGGIGISFARLRGTGAKINGRNNAGQGITFWIKIFDTIARAVNQGGKREGAITCQLPIWHIDINSFLEIQSINGDIDTKSYVIQPQITLPDLYMETFKAKGLWYTFCPHEVESKLNIKLAGVYDKEFERNYLKAVEAYKAGKLTQCQVYPAENLMKRMITSLYQTGMPYLVFIDKINRDNPNSHVGGIPCVNLCVESYSVVEPDKYTHTCNLASLVLGRCQPSELIDLARLCTKVLNHGLSLTTNPTPEGQLHNEMFRTIGVGMMGLADYLVAQGKTYYDLDFIAEIAEQIEYGCVMASIEIAKETQPYPFFSGSKWDTGEMIARFKQASTSRNDCYRRMERIDSRNERVDWDEAGRLLELYGIANSQLTSPAPNTTTSLVAGGTSGVMPPYDLDHRDANGKGSFSLVPMYAKTHAEAYIPQYAYDQTHLSKVVGRLQAFVDAGISSEYILDRRTSLKAKPMRDLILACYENQTKAIYYVRSYTGKSDLKGMIKTEACSACAN